ncbi:MAG TPA: 4-oxalocrotonate tautomerase family protein [Spirochaetota bacterium]|jgi:4-oxalocrotonate tautomerase|nr:4-oxalocrotonate tautomerase family protein [Spirochaetota bacterium]OQA98001.1 MAG: 2-hydroxymuconate tautomerase [Spirochaetes bacterium ADurb.Bin218]HOK00998.1 4-oxalocrotonate tautomerase family protein [Spirochaetota bacterium]HOK91325.1 4-oxalocrotonate tautomerase family protein [Spirochaetota bacterium]HON14850.1 4-oxalocrotonate tautomerase family protein [Spirochaetota bacterium]
MPYVNVKVAGPLTKEQRSAIAEKITEVLHEVAGKKPNTTYVVFEEIERDHWAAGGKLLSDM